MNIALRWDEVVVALKKNDKVESKSNFKFSASNAISFQPTAMKIVQSHKFSIGKGIMKNKILEKIDSNYFFISNT